MTKKHQPRSMPEVQPRNPLHGITLETLLSELVRHHGWEGLGRKIDIRCFTHEPSIASSLKFLRRTPWARERVESLYLVSLPTETGKPGRAGIGNATIQMKDDSK
jgi:uncharacterized protein (DUF2132 family)